MGKFYCIRTAVQLVQRDSESAPGHMNYSTAHGCDHFSRPRRAVPCVGYVSLFIPTLFTTLSELRFTLRMTTHILPNIGVSGITSESIPPQTTPLSISDTYHFKPVIILL